MKELSCEMCGSTNVIRQDGLYVCQACGTKYSPEDAKNLMVEGVVKIDKSSEIENFKKLANRYYSNGEYDKAEEYYTKCIEIDPDDWESVYYKGFSAGYQSTLSNYRINETINAAQNAINLVEPDERSNKMEIFRTEILNLFFAYKTNIFNVINENKNRLSESDVSDYLTDNMNIINDTEATLNIFPPENVELNDPVATSYEMIISCCSALSGSYKYVWGYDMQTTKNEYKRFIIKSSIIAFGKAKKEEYLQKMKTLNPEYKLPRKKGCYVATAVYGSYNCPEVWTLRRFRDQRLKQTLGGRLFIKLYYSTSPTLVKYFGNTKAFKNFFKPRLDKFVHKLQEEGVESTFYLGD